MGKRFNKIMSLILACMIGASLAACEKENTESSHESSTDSSQIQVQKYTVSVTGGTGSGSYDEGTQVTVKAEEAPDGYRFIGWYSGNEKVSPAEEYTFTVDSDVTLAAQYSDYTGALAYLDKFDSSKNNFWDGGEWANCQGQSQTDVANSTDGAYMFSMRTADKNGVSLLPAEYTLPKGWIDDRADIWATSTISFGEGKDLTNSTIEFDVKFDNMAKGITVLAISGEAKAYEGYVTVNKNNFSDLADVWDSCVNITELEDGWYHYEYDFGTFATLSDDAQGSKATILGECDRLDFIFLNGSVSYRNELCRNIDYTKESKAYLDNVCIYEKAVERVTLTVEGGKSSGRYKKDSEVTVKATVPEGSAFAGWYNGSEKVSETEEYTFTITADTTLVAKYVDADYSMNLNFYDVFNPERRNEAGKIEPNYWDGGDWANCKGEVQSTVTNGSDYAYKFSMKTTDDDGVSLLPADFTLPTWWTDGRTDIWTRSVVELDSLDLTNSLVAFDVKFDNMAKGVTLRGVSSSGMTWDNWVAVDGKNVNGAPDAGASYVRVTDLGNGWYHYEYDFAKFAVADGDKTGAEANVVGECEQFMFIFLNGRLKGNENATNIDYSKESVAYIDNIVILDKDEADLAKGLTAVHGKVETVKEGFGSKECKKYTLDAAKNNNDKWDLLSIAIDSANMAGKKVVFDVKFDNLSQCIQLYIGSATTTYCFIDGKNCNGGADPALAAYTVTELADGWYRYEIDASTLAASAEGKDISAVTSIGLGLAPGNVAGWKHALNKVDAAKDGVMWIDNFKIV